MSDRGGLNTLDRQGSHFFLSYAHSWPLEGSLDTDPDPDQWVQQFFDDLSEAVDQHPGRRRDLAAGFFDQDIPAGSNLNQSLSQALSSAEVFVPLYSPNYLTRAWPGREWASFRRRVVEAGLANPDRRFVPVLWTPLSGLPEPPGFEAALAVGATESGYAENGLQALLRFSPYHDSYRAVVSELAESIVTVAQEFQLQPSAVQDIDMTQSEFWPGAALAKFTIEVAAPTARSGRPVRTPAEYGADSIEWRPFAGQVPLAEYAKQVAERLDFEVEVSGLRKGSANRGPGIILIDPRFAVDERGRKLLQSEVSQVPRWVLPLLITNSPGDAQSAQRAKDVRAILGAAARPTESSRRAVQGVSSLEEFAAIVPKLVAEAERQYLRHGGSAAPLGEPAKRPRLGGGPQPGRPHPKPHSPGEAPHA